MNFEDLLCDERSSRLAAILPHRPVKGIQNFFPVVTVGIARTTHAVVQVPHKRFVAVTKLKSQDSAVPTPTPTIIVDCRHIPLRDIYNDMPPLEQDAG